MTNRTRWVALLLALVAASACGAPRAARTQNDDALLRAAETGSHDTVKELLTAKDIDVNTRDDSGATPLILAARGGHEDTVKALLVAGADVKAQDKAGKSALVYASAGGHDDTVKALMEAGAAAPK